MALVSAGAPAASAVLLDQLRPRQWVKNLLVAAPVAAAGAIADPSMWWPLGVAFLAMCMAASSTYVVNDLHDIESDRHHEVKRARPLASGALTQRTGKVLAAFAAVVALALAGSMGWKPLAAIAVYLAVTYAYSFHLKHVPVVELVVVAIGFPLRAIFGGLATDTNLTTNFLLVVGSGAVFVVAAKRAAELIELGGDAADHRATLGTYSMGYLRLVQSVAMATMVVVYGLWTFGGEVSSSSESIVWFQFSLVPFVVALLRYAWLVDCGQAGAPEEVFLRDRTMKVLAVAWALLYGMGIALG